MHQEKRQVDDATLALPHLVTFKDRGRLRAWKGFDWDALNRLHDPGLIGDPLSKAKSVALTDEGQSRSEELIQDGHNEQQLVVARGVPTRLVRRRGVYR